MAGEKTGEIHLTRDDVKGRGNQERELKGDRGTSLVVQWPRPHAPNAGGPGSIPGQGARSHMQQLKKPHTTTKTWCSQIHEYIFLKGDRDRKNRGNRKRKRA